MTDNPEPDAPGNALSWLEKPSSMKALALGLYVACAALIAVDFITHKHSPFAIEHTYAFYAWFGFAAALALALAARVMRRILMRPENYYDR